MTEIEAGVMKITNSCLFYWWKWWFLK